MAQIFDGKLYVHYGQAYIFTYIGCDFYLDDCFTGQVNGLCGTIVPGVVFLITGLHTGDVGLTVEVLESRPPVDASWEEIVEAPFTVGAEADEDGPRIEDWKGDLVCNLPIAMGNYRIRYCARNMDEASGVDTLLEGEDTIDFYALYIWPDEVTPDEVIKQTSRRARYWHGVARDWTQHAGLSRNPNGD